MALRFQRIKGLFLYFLPRLFSQLTDNQPIHLFSFLLLTDRSEKFHTERLKAERTVVQFWHQYTDVWFLCKTNLG